MNGKGSVTIEAAIFLPIFIISICTIGFIMKLYLAQECLQHALSDQVVKVASEAYLEYKMCPEELSGLLGMAEPLKKQIHSKIRQHFTEKAWDAMYVSEGPTVVEFRYLFDGRYDDYLVDDPYYIDSDYLIEAISISQVEIPFPIQFARDIFLTQRVISRAWVGTEKSKNPMNFEEMAENYKGKIVFIFPRAGERYHDKNCMLISNYPVLKILTRGIRGEYEACKLCEASELKNGSNIYIFEKSGKVYHTKNCVLVDKYVVSIELVDAEHQGYMPCKKCKPNAFH